MSTNDDKRLLHLLANKEKVVDAYLVPAGHQYIAVSQNQLCLYDGSSDVRDFFVVPVAGEVSSEAFMSSIEAFLSRARYVTEDVKAHLEQMLNDFETGTDSLEKVETDPDYVEFLNMGE